MGSSVVVLVMDAAEKAKESERAREGHVLYDVSTHNTKMHIYFCVSDKDIHGSIYGVAITSRLLKNICLFCRIVSFIGLFCKRDLSF